jgi:Uma2 family endonuclease
MALSILQPPAASDELPRKRFTRAEVERMMDIGLFEGQRFELIDGDLINKMGQKPPHASAIQLCMIMLAKIFALELVRVQLSMEASAPDRETSEPEPDLAVLAAAKADFKRRHPNGSELALIVEIADTSLRQDTIKKRGIYARAGVPEYWVLDLNGRRLIVHRDLDARSGQYLAIQNYGADESVPVPSRLGQSIPVSDLLP